MPGSGFKDASHLVRLALAFLAALLLFVVVRAAVVPVGFGRYGHYRADAIKDNQARKISFAGQDTCAMCHDEVAKAKESGKHKTVHCEACHGPNAAHATSDDPSGSKPKKPNVTLLCVRCHEHDTARPRGFPQVDSKDHSGGQVCNTCHQPHHPNFS
jgi:hypothetical protein